MPSVTPVPSPTPAVTPTTSPTAANPPPATPPATQPSPVPTLAAVVLIPDVRGTALALNSSEVFYSGWDQRLAPSSTQLFFTIHAVAKTGGPSRFVAESPDTIVELVANDAWVYWTTSDGSPRTGLYRAPAAGGATELVMQGNHFSQIAIDDGAAYVVNDPDGTWGPGGATVYAVPHAGGPPVALQTGVTLWGWRSGLAADASHVYYVDDPPPMNQDGTQDTAFIRRVSKSGGVAETVVACVDDWSCGWFVLAVDAKNLYSRDRTGQVYARTKDRRTTMAITSALLGQDLDVSGDTVCWNVPWSGPRSDPSPYPIPGIRCANVDATGIHDVDTGLVYGWYAPRVDERYVYYVKGPALIRQPR